MIAIDGILDQHVALQAESVDRVCLNLYVPRLQQPGGIYTWLQSLSNTIGDNTVPCLRRSALLAARLDHGASAPARIAANRNRDWCHVPSRDHRLGALPAIHSCATGTLRCTSSETSGTMI